MRTNTQEAVLSLSLAPESISTCLPRAEMLVSVTEDIDMSKPSVGHVAVENSGA